MNDILKISEAVEVLGSRRAVVATVVETHGSTYRKAGARLLLDSEGESVGAITGGCLSRDLERRMQVVLKSGNAELVDYDTQSEADAVWGSGAGCGGVMVLFIQPLTEDLRGWIASLKASADARETADSAIVVKSTLPWRCGRGEIIGPGALCPECGAIPSRTHPQASLHRCPIGEWRFFEQHQPPVSLTICGAGNDSRPLARFAVELGWQVAVVDWRDALLLPSRYPTGVKLVHYTSADDLEDNGDRNSAVVLASHDFLRDVEFLEHFARHDVAYIGLLGPKSRGNRIVESLGGVERRNDLSNRIFSPAGIDLASESPEEIALAIVAEIQACLSGADAGFLSSKRSSIHERRRHDVITSR